MLFKHGSIKHHNYDNYHLESAKLRGLRGTGIMADVCDKDLYDLKILEAIDYIKSVSKKKSTKERILKHMARSNLKLQEEVLQMLLDNLEEEGILENRGDESSECFYSRVHRKLCEEKTESDRNY